MVKVERLPTLILNSTMGHCFIADLDVDLLRRKTRIQSTNSKAQNNVLDYTLENETNTNMT